MWAQPLSVPISRLLSHEKNCKGSKGFLSLHWRVTPADAFMHWLILSVSYVIITQVSPFLSPNVPSYLNLNYATLNLFILEPTILMNTARMNSIKVFSVCIYPTQHWLRGAGSVSELFNGGWASCFIMKTVPLLQTICSILKFHRLSFWFGTACHLRICISTTSHMKNQHQYYKSSEKSILCTATHAGV